MILSILCFKNKKINKIICKTNEIISALTFISAGVLSLIAALLTIYLNKGKDFVDGDSYEKFKSASTLIADITIVIYFFIDTVIIPIIKENLIEFLNDTTTNTKGKKGKL
ncbi:hypothetical protein FACS189459_1610 [Bacilli bacterium]|nr:hypothetical protein FACS189459_1610 [Bacilli bacterium]